MTDDPTERKLRLAEAVRPYDQDGYPPWVEGEPRPFDWPPERPRRPFLSHLHRWGLIYIAVVLIVFLAFAAGVWRGHRDVACHSITEDSVITDCDFRDGGWYPE